MVRVHSRQIPSEGLHLEGETDSACLGFEELDIQVLSPLKYSLDVGVSEGGFFATGKLSLKVTLKCVATLEDFPYDIEVENFAVQIELKGDEVVDLTPMIREDILLNLPPYPRLDREGAQESNTHQKQIGSISPEGESAHGSPAWDVLNKLKTKK
ncbi:MAG: YceD family protein [Chthoniobacterales bacterium]